MMAPRSVVLASLLTLCLYASSALGSPQHGPPQYGSESMPPFSASSNSTAIVPSATVTTGSAKASASGNQGGGTASAVPTGGLLQCASSLNGQLPSPTPANWNFNGKIRRYYVAAEEVEWNYAPTGWDNWLGVPLAVSPRANMAGANTYGTTWLKALYRGYTDSSFTVRSKQPPWQGTQGPTLRSEVGDLIEIMFVNNLSKNYATMHSMGLAYTKYSEGADYPNNTAPGQQVKVPESEAVPPVEPGVAPGGCVVYKWMVTPADGPGFGEPATVHSYHSYVALQQDTNAGLIGPQIVYAPGQMETTMASYREIPLLYMIYEESMSWLSGQNAAALGASSSTSAPGYSGGYGSIGSPGFGISETGSLSPGNYSVWHPQLVNLAGAEQFMSAPSFYTMNGYIFANNPTYEMCLDDKVIWYVNAYGSASHVFHMHGNGFAYNGANYYAMSLNDGEGKTLYMDATGAGKWQVICHVNMHHDLGMVSNYQVYYAGQCPLPPLSS